MSKKKILYLFSEEISLFLTWCYKCSCGDQIVISSTKGYLPLQFWLNMLNFKIQNKKNFGFNIFICLKCIIFSDCFSDAMFLFSYLIHSLIVKIENLIISPLNLI